MASSKLVAMVVVVLAIPLAALLNMPIGSKPCSPAHNRTQQYSMHMKHTSVPALVIILDIYPDAKMHLLATMQQVSCKATAMCPVKLLVSGSDLQLVWCGLTVEMHLHHMILLTGVYGL